MANAKSKKVYTDALIGPFKLEHVHLSSPDTEGPYADSKYKCDAVAEKDDPAMIEALEIQKAAIAACGLSKHEGLQKAIKAHKAKNGDKKEATGKLMIRAKTARVPVIADASGKPIPPKALAKLKIGAGTVALLNGYFTDYQTSEKLKDRETGEVEIITVTGVSFTLKSVQIIELKKGGANSDGGFSAYAGGGFTYEDDGDEDEGPEDYNRDEGGDDAPDGPEDDGLDI